MAGDRENKNGSGRWPFKQVAGQRAGSDLFSGPTISAREKIIIVLTAIVSIVAVLAGFGAIYYGVAEPKWLHLSDGQETESAANADFSGVAKDTIDIMDFLADTDNDGLTDYEEINVYGTSAFLGDTDGDGLSDKEEILRGENPLCDGENCFRSETATEGGNGTATSTDDSRFLDYLSPGAMDSLTTDVTAESSAGTIDPASLSAEEIRQMLAEAGIDESLLNQFTDEELRQMFLETVNQQTTTE